ncbi:RNA polymerase sigma factor [Niastella populi]|uniref:RNA polymerase sigma-70 region 4 domain-containing protein n=1 Tax=Niastella populi TaxID=550983 RepID=A0A1V9FKX9_9BACT|nr:sigma-70 family RNA polymerase sigma factor [Niastella populi]OQP58980.1 hypothetical protein A4R26_21560 [Niastella populi]
MEEKEVIKGLRDHNPAALREILKLYKDQVLLTIAGRYHNFTKAEIEDIITDTFKDVWLTKPEFKSLINVRRYLYRTALNKSNTLVRHQQFLARRDKELAYMYDNQQETLDVKRRREYAINYVISHFPKLPARSRQVLNLMIEEKLSDEEIADRLKISINSVHQARKRGIQKLKEMLGNSMPDDPNALTYLLIFLIQLNSTGLKSDMYPLLF